MANATPNTPTTAAPAAIPAIAILGLVVDEICWGAAALRMVIVGETVAVPV